MSKVNILVVDDLPEKLLAFRTILEELNENLVMAQSGEAALRQLLEQDFAVILLDVNMPGMNGFETAKLIRGRRKSALIPIIFITAFSDEIHTAQGYSLGAVDYILTPVVPEILRTKVKVFVDLFRMTEQVRKQGEQQLVLVREQSARAAAEEARERLAYVAEASRVLASSLDPEETLAELVQLPIPRLAEQAVVVLLDERGEVTRIRRAAQPTDASAVVSGDITLEELQPELTSAIRRVVGRPQTETFVEDGQRRVLLPLLGRGRLLGVLALLGRAGAKGAEFQEVTVAEDLSRRAAIALDNARLYHNIQEGDRRKSEFLSMLAHELRNPLAPIRNACALMQILQVEDPDLNQARDIIDRQVSHMTRLIDELLDISRLVRDKILLRKEAVDFTELVRTTTEDYRSSLANAGMTLAVTLPAAPVWVWGDPTRLAQVIGNVLSNAEKFTDAQGKVCVHLAATDDALILEVRDTGIGMDATMLSRVFETFAQADRSLDRSKGGLGLGLALVKGLVGLHEGSVAVHSEGLGRGTQVTIRLPLHVPSAPLSAPSARPVQESSLNILIVEDNRDAAESMRVLLSRLGHQVQVAHTGEVGFEVARRLLPEVVLCDLGLPGQVDGYQFAQLARATPELRDKYLIAITGYGQAEDRLRSQQAGFNAHLTKPVDVGTLRQLLAALSTQQVSGAT